MDKNNRQEVEYIELDVWGFVGAVSQIQWEEDTAKVPKDEVYDREGKVRDVYARDLWDLHQRYMLLAHEFYRYKTNDYGEE